MTTRFSDHEKTLEMKKKLRSSTVSTNDEYPEKEDSNDLTGADQKKEELKVSKDSECSPQNKRSNKLHPKKSIPSKTKPKKNASLPTDTKKANKLQKKVDDSLELSSCAPSDEDLEEEFKQFMIIKRKGQHQEDITKQGGSKKSKEISKTLQKLEGNIIAIKKQISKDQKHHGGRHPQTENCQSSSCVLEKRQLQQGKESHRRSHGILDMKLRHVKEQLASTQKQCRILERELEEKRDVIAMLKKQLEVAEKTASATVPIRYHEPSSFHGTARFEPYQRNDHRHHLHRHSHQLPSKLYNRPAHNSNFYSNRRGHHFNNTKGNYN